MLCVKKSRIIWNGHANIGKQKSFLKKYTIKINIIAIIKLCEISYNVNIQGVFSWSSESSGLPSWIVVGLTIILNKK